MRTVEGSAGSEMALDPFRGVIICILVRGTGHGDVLVGSRVVVLRNPQNAPVLGDIAVLGRI